MKIFFCKSSYLLNQSSYRICSCLIFFKKVHTLDWFSLQAAKEHHTSIIWRVFAILALPLYLIWRRVMRFQCGCNGISIFRFSHFFWVCTSSVFCCFLLLNNKRFCSSTTLIYQSPLKICLVFRRKEIKENSTQRRGGREQNQKEKSAKERRREPRRRVARKRLEVFEPLAGVGGAKNLGSAAVGCERCAPQLFVLLIRRRKFFAYFASFSSELKRRDEYVRYVPAGIFSSVSAQICRCGAVRGDATRAGESRAAAEQTDSWAEAGSMQKPLKQSESEIIPFCGVFMECLTYFRAYLRWTRCRSKFYPPIYMSARKGRFWKNCRATGRTRRDEHDSSVIVWFPFMFFFCLFQSLANSFEAELKKRFFRFLVKIFRRGST